MRKRIVVSVVLAFFLCVTILVFSKGSELEKASKDNTKGSIIAEMSYYIDLNLDGKKDKISITFENMDNGNSIYNLIASGYTIEIVEGKNTFNLTEENVNVSNLRIGFIEMNSKIYFYVNDDGPSDDFQTLLYELKENGIEKLEPIIGHIENHDDKVIYTKFSKINDKYSKILSYYDIENGNIFVDKEMLIGEKIEFPYAKALFKNPSDVSNANGANLSYEELEEYLKSCGSDKLVEKIVQANEELIMVDIDTTFGGLLDGKSTRNINIKVKTNDGVEGWLSNMNGGD